jgi:hypothetical protein
VHVYPYKKRIDLKSDTRLVLENDELDDFVVYAHYSPAIVYITDVLETAQGYTVVFQAREAEEEPGTIYADLYSLEGGFKRRIRLESRPMPCVNCPEIFMVQEIDGEEWVMPWEPPFGN